MAKLLTKRQQTVIDVIRAWIKERGYPPTIRELGQKLGIKSLRGVTTHLDAIQKKGFLKREPRARSISLSDLVAPFERAIRVPILGRIRAVPGNHSSGSGFRRHRAGLQGHGRSRRARARAAHAQC